MKILFLSHDSHLHGATRSMLDLAEEFSNKGHEAKVILPTGGLAENYLKNKHIPFKKVFYPLFIQYGKEDKLKTQFKKLYSAFRHLPKLVSYVNKYNPDIIYINTSVNYWLLILSFFYKKPIILHLREFGKEDHAVFKNFKGLIFNLLKKRATLYLSNSQAIQQYYREKYQIKSYLLYNGVFTKEAFIQNSILKKKQAQNKTTTISVVGNITTGKGQLEILKAFHLLSKNYPDIKLVFVGAGDTSTLEAFINDNQLQSLVFITGFQENTELHYLKTDILVANSIREAFGRVLIEASSYAIPVIARSTGASTEIIINQETGILHDGSIESIYQAIQKLLHDNKLRSRLGEAGWKRCSELYNFEYSFQQLESVVNQLYIDAKH